MANGVEHRRPKVTATTAGVSNAHVDNVITNFGINSFPSIRVGFHDGNIPESGVMKMAGPDVAARVSAQQTAMFTAQAPNNSVEIQDGSGGTLSFNGYVSGPEYSLGIQDVGFNTTLVHEASAVTNLNTSIYNRDLAIFRGQRDFAADIAENLWSILDTMVDRRKHVHPDEESKAIAEQIHTNNTTPLEIWEAICNNSEAEWPELPPLAKTSATLRLNLTSGIADIYKNSYNDFFQSIQQFQAMFSMIYVPSLTAGEMGRFISVENAITGDGEDMKVNVRSIRMSAGPRSIMPLSYVIVRGPKPKDFRNLKHGHVIQRWPKSTQSNGQVVEIGTPSWLPTHLTTARQSSATVGDTLDLSAYQQQLVDGDKKLYQTTFPLVGKLLERWAKQHYVDFALANSYAELVTDLNLGAAPGVRYTVSTPNGTLFKGFLVNVEHGVTSKPTQVSAYTRLRFSHIEAEGFELPSKE